MSFHNHWTTFSLSENNLSKIFNQFFCAKIRVEDSVCCWHFKSLSLISPLASLRRNKCSLHASFIFHIVILHAKIRAVIKYNFAHSEPPLQTLPWKKDLIWGFGTKRNLLFLEEKKFWFTNKINFLKEYSPARVKVVNENTSQSPEVLFILNSYFLGLHCLALPPNISADRKSFLGDQFVFPSPPSALSYTHIPNLLNIFKKIQGYLKKCSN